ncbi:transcriptional regulator [Thermoclostridium stercorarium subsp. thermolacticum DSM 2910]|jgi:YebC/PmpR family DNA-binding regulatory protein|uniref:Probable transcriptional regulatory protein CSTERLE_11930 n=2 Tax=Thermoclostridium stercorarium TaxID=1510 RepID=A0A1B1YN66_THEST|nr:YebC/PmpR family DNA-binding transcriptional regulator [Thermoclostridium stercorarium]ANW99600.1 transcriptional regulator [Thermoclostridium stercorarium subsp. thermolacticum DSM 2910]ANX02227.1 transcriptional regulator [Thermoclostridium stercorarium subsp. leptospartum DSM 9219]UZQ85303.1 YebC/PmpR family DNA-binding transcriptional regulator [Thermoclostridium stercorarium]
MSGHSKWANIRHKKEKTDAQKGKIFTKLGREIAMAVKAGGPDPETNSRLKDAIAKAKANNMPNENIMRSIKKAAGDISTDDYEEIVYEGYGPGGVAIIVETLTNNRNRTAGDIRHIFDKYGGNLGTTGCVSFMFDKRGQIIIEKNDSIDEDSLMMSALEAGALDVAVEDEYYEIITEPQDFSKVADALEKEGYKFESAEVAMIPKTTTTLTNEEMIANMEKLIEKLEDHDDVQNIYHNWEQE